MNRLFALLIDIGTGELSRLEVIGTLAKMHLKPPKDDAKLAMAAPLTSIAAGAGVNLFNSQGNPWTADYVKITGEPLEDRTANDFRNCLAASLDTTRMNCYRKTGFTSAACS